MSRVKNKASKGLPHLEARKWEIGPDYKFISYLGHGAYGMVIKALHIPSGKEVAIKKILNLFDNETDTLRILREIYLIKRLNHPCVDKLLQILDPIDPKTFREIFLVLELADSDLKKVINSV